MAMRSTTTRRPSTVNPNDRTWRVTIESRPVADVQDEDSGEPIDGPWTTLVSACPMARFELSAGERFAANQETASADARWEMTYRADMDPDLIDVPKRRRLVVRGRTLDITGASLISYGGAQLGGIELLTLASTKVT